MIANMLLQSLPHCQESCTLDCNVHYTCMCVMCVHSEHLHIQVQMLSEIKLFKFGQDQKITTIRQIGELARPILGNFDVIYGRLM